MPGYRKSLPGRRPECEREHCWNTPLAANHCFPHYWPSLKKQRQLVQYAIRVLNWPHAAPVRWPAMAWFNRTQEVGDERRGKDTSKSKAGQAGTAGPSQKKKKRGMRQQCTVYLHGNVHEQKGRGGSASRNSRMVFFEPQRCLHAGGSPCAPRATSDGDTNPHTGNRESLIQRSCLCNTRARSLSQAADSGRDCTSGFCHHSPFDVRPTTEGCHPPCNGTLHPQERTGSSAFVAFSDAASRSAGKPADETRLLGPAQQGPPTPASMLYRNESGNVASVASHIQAQREDKRKLNISSCALLCQVWVHPPPPKLCACPAHHSTQACRGFSRQNVACAKMFCWRVVRAVATSSGIFPQSCSSSATTGMLSTVPIFSRQGDSEKRKARTQKSQGPTKWTRHFRRRLVT